MKCSSAETCGGHHIHITLSVVEWRRRAEGKDQFRCAGVQSSGSNGRVASGVGGDPGAEGITAWERESKPGRMPLGGLSERW